MTESWEEDVDQRLNRLERQLFGTEAIHQCTVLQKHNMHIWCGYLVDNQSTMKQLPFMVRRCPACGRVVDHG